MASTENGSTQRTGNVTPLITPVNNGVPSNSHAETNINYSSNESNFDSSSNGITQLAQPKAPLTKLGIVNPNGNQSDSSISFYSVVAINDNNEYGITTSGGAQLAVPSNPVVLVNYYKMRGFYSIGSVYETWVITGSPSVSPPSGHSLNNVAIEAFWQS